MTKENETVNEQTEQQKQIVEQALATKPAYRYNDADQREAGFDSDEYR